jgi:antirestriction protein ArdC
MPATTEREDLRTRITHQIIEQLERGVCPWMKPWSTEHLVGRVSRPLRAGGQPYRGINVLLLWVAAKMKGYAAPIWMTYRQAAELDGQVRKGERASPVTYADSITRQEVAEDGSEQKHEIWFLNQYSVFNVEQIDGLPAHFYVPAATVLYPMARIARADAFFAAAGMRWQEGGSVAAYNVTADLVRMPPFESFRDPKVSMRRSRMRPATGRATRPA